MLRIGHGLTWTEIAAVLAGEGRRVEEATLAKRFSRLKARLARMARRGGFVD